MSFSGSDHSLHLTKGGINNFHCGGGVIESKHLRKGGGHKIMLEIGGVIKNRGS